MSDHTAVRIKGSRWQAIAQRTSRGGWLSGGRMANETSVAGSNTAKIESQEDLVLDLALRHFSSLGLTSREARDVSEALLASAATGQTVTVFPASSTEHPYEFSRRLAAVTIRCGKQTIRLPMHAARKLATLVNRLVKRSPAREFAM